MTIVIGIDGSRLSEDFLTTDAIRTGSDRSGDKVVTYFRHNPDDPHGIPMDTLTTGIVSIIELGPKIPEHWFPLKYIRNPRWLDLDIKDYLADLDEYFNSEELASTREFYSARLEIPFLAICLEALMYCEQMLFYHKVVPVTDPASLADLEHVRHLRVALQDFANDASHESHQVLMAPNYSDWPSIFRIGMCMAFLVPKGQSEAFLAHLAHVGTRVREGAEKGQNRQRQTSEQKKATAIAELKRRFAASQGRRAKKTILKEMEKDGLGSLRMLNTYCLGVELRLSSNDNPPPIAHA